MDIQELSGIYSYSIITLGNKYFIPGVKSTAYGSFFDSIAIDFLNESFLGSGWVFDKAGIEDIKCDFQEQSVSFVELDALHMVFSKAQR